MKNIVLPLVFVLSALVQAQVSIGKDKVSNASVSLDFSTTENKGLLLPYVENKADITENGTLIFDATDKKIKYFKDKNWFDLSVDDTGKVDLSIQTGKVDHQTSKVGVGNPTTTDGILVLEDHDKAMILPKVENPHLNIINPSAGMIVYDTISHQLAVYNGTVWSFWKP